MRALLTRAIRARIEAAAAKAEAALRQEANRGPLPLEALIKRYGELPHETRLELHRRAEALAGVKVPIAFEGPWPGLKTGPDRNYLLALPPLKVQDLRRWYPSSLEALAAAWADQVLRGIRGLEEFPLEEAPRKVLQRIPPLEEEVLEYGAYLKKLVAVLRTKAEQGC